MQFRHFFSLYGMPFFFLFCFAQSGLAQEVSTNASGDKIVVFEDGSWRYFNPETDQGLESEVQAPVAVSEKVDGKGKVKTKKVKKAKKAKKVKKAKVKQKKVKKNKKNKPAKVGKAKKQKKVKSGKKKKVNKSAKKNKKGKNKKGKQKKGKQKKNKKSKGKKIVMADVTPAMIHQSEQLAARRAERAAAESAKAHRVFENISLERVFLEKELQDGYASLSSTDGDIAEIESKLQLVRAKETIALTNYQEADALAKEYERMVHMSYPKREKMLAKMQMQNEANDAGMMADRSGGAGSEELTKEERKKSSAMKLERAKMDVTLFPPKPPCRLVFDGLDEFSGKIRRDLAKERFFSFTNEKMRPYFKDSDFITCEGHLTALSGGVYFLNLELEVASENAQRDYGFLEKGAVMVIKMIDETTVRIVNRKTDMGTLNPLQNSVIYKPQYLIGSNQVKELSKGEVDRIRLVWSSGYEDYEIFELDFFSNQFRCLEVN